MVKSTLTCCGHSEGRSRLALILSCISWRSQPSLDLLCTTPRPIPSSHRTALLRDLQARVQYTNVIYSLMPNTLSLTWLARLPKKLATAAGFRSPRCDVTNCWLYLSLTLSVFRSDSAGRSRGNSENFATLWVTVRWWGADGAADCCISLRPILTGSKRLPPTKLTRGYRRRNDQTLKNALYITRFNIHKLYTLPTQCVCVFCVDLRTNRLFHYTALTGWFV